LADRARDALKHFSGGQRHRVWLARALVRRPELLIMDEPLAGVDAASAQALVDVLRATPGLTSLVVLHEAGPFADYLTRVIVLEGGAVAADGPPDALTGRAPHHHHDTHPGRSQAPDLAGYGTGTAAPKLSFSDSGPRRTSVGAERGTPWRRLGVRA
jgi:zinc transport system ATP-binding protein